MEPTVDPSEQIHAMSIEIIRHVLGNEKAAQTATREAQILTMAAFTESREVSRELDKGHPVTRPAVEDRRAPIPK